MSHVQSNVKWSYFSDQRYFCSVRDRSLAEHIGGAAARNRCSIWIWTLIDCSSTSNLDLGRFMSTFEVIATGTDVV